MPESTANVEKRKNSSVKILIVDDHTMTAELLSDKLEKNTEFEVVKILKTGNDVFEYDNFENIDVVLLDYFLPDMKGCDVIKGLKKRQINLLSVVLSASSDFKIIKKCFELGAHGFVSKESKINDVINSINSVLDGGNYICNKTVSAMVKNNFSNLEDIDDNHSKLTNREKEILECISDGMKNHEIANKLYISERTVETHRRNIIKKFGQKTIVGVINDWKNGYNQELN